MNMDSENYKKVLKAGLEEGSGGVIVFITEDALRPEKWEIQTQIFQ